MYRQAQGYVVMTVIVYIRRKADETINPSPSTGGQKMKRLLLILIVSVFTVCFFSPTYAADYPKKDLQGVIMWGAGGATDNVTRAITPHVEPFLGKQIILISTDNMILVPW